MLCTSISKVAMGKGALRSARREVYKMTGKRVLIVLGLALLVTACGGWGADHGNGTVIMAPFTDEEFGIRGNAPAEGWAERAALLQQSFPGTTDELTAFLIEETDLIGLPKPTGTYRGSAWTWQLYRFETQLQSADPGIYRLDMGLAQGEAAIYLVTLVTMPMEYEDHAALYESVFTHAMYALAPLG
jgi:hypothetical protein